MTARCRAAELANRDRLDRLAHALLQKETLDEDEAYAAVGVSRDTAPAMPVSQ
jgi:cell division protease FtsH